MNPLSSSVRDVCDQRGDSTPGPGSRPPPHVPAASTPEQKAVTFLGREVPRWSRQNHCFSCHNNGDAARRFFQASRAGIEVPDDALADTIAWLQKPEAWDHNGGEGPFVDKRLARVAFTAALAAAVSTGSAQGSQSPVEGRRAACARPGRRRIVADSKERIPCSAPATYGRPLATFLARESLATAEPMRFRTPPSIAPTPGSETRKVQNVTDASVSLLWLAAAERPSDAELASIAHSSCLRAPRPQMAAGGPTPSHPPSPSIPRSLCSPSRNASPRRPQSR